MYCNVQLYVRALLSELVSRHINLRRNYLVTMYCNVQLYVRALFKNIK